MPLLPAGDPAVREVRPQMQRSSSLSEVSRQSHRHGRDRPPTIWERLRASLHLAPANLFSPSLWILRTLAVAFSVLSAVLIAYSISKMLEAPDVFTAGAAVFARLRKGIHVGRIHR